MFSNTKLRSAVRFALGLSAGTLALGASSGAMAQDDAAEELEEITVTGSRIKRADLASASPVTVIDRDAIMAQGITDIGNLIQRMPSMSGTPLGTTTNNGGDGSVEIDLRGMGVNRTVTLVNGKRTVDGGDYTTIPAIMIERVEILKDGASAVYGADAVAGVVNIITRTDFEGLNIDVQTADWFNTDAGQQNSIALIGGTTFDGGNFMFGAEYIDQEEAFQRDTPWDIFQGSYYIYYDTDIGCEVDPANLCTFFGSSRIPQSRLNFIDSSGEFLAQAGTGRFLIDTPATSPYEVGLMVPHDGRTYNYAPVNYMQTPYERLNVFGEGNFELTDNVQFHAQFRANERKSSQELAPLPYDTNIDPSFNGFWQGAPFLGVSVDNYYLRRAIDLYNATNGTTLPYEPIDNARRRMTETPRQFIQDTSQYQAIIGLSGTVNDIDWDVYYNRGKRTRIDNDFGQFSGIRLQNSLGPSADLDGDGQPECYTDVTDPNTIITGCVPMNLFGGEGTLIQDMIDYVGVELVDSRVTDQEIWAASLTGSAFELPGGQLGWAAGASYWDQHFKYTPDSAKSLGSVTGGTGFGTDGGLRNIGIFGEVYAPVFDNGTQSLTLTAGVRRDDYNLFGSDTTWQLGVEFQVIDSLKLRGTAGTAFRAPTIEELFDGLQDSAPLYNDPCAPLNYQPNPRPPGCPRDSFQTDTQVTSLVGGNEALIPETADTFTAGFVWTPDFAGADLSLTVDWWKIELEDAISTFGVQFTLDQCYIEQVQASCDLITRRNDADFTIQDIIDTQVNVATQEGSGIDTEIRAAFDTEIGQFEVALLWARLLDRNRVVRPGAPEENMVGLHFKDVTAEDGGTYAEDKFNFSLHYYRGGFSVGYLAEFIGEITANSPFVDYSYTVDSFLYHDLVFNYELNQWGTTRLTLGISNLSDEKPPFIDNAFNAKTDPNTYRMFGTGYFFRISQTFE